MNDVASEDWEDLRRLAERLELPTERIALIRARRETSRERPGAPYTLLVGRPDAGIELLIREWISPEAADELRGAGGRPVVIGPSPEAVRPRLAAWPTRSTTQVQDGHVLVLREERRPAPEVLAGLASLGMIDQVVLVCRLFQAMHAHEIEIMRLLSGLASTARVLLVWRDGEQPDDRDLAEVPESAAQQLRRLGFGDGRCLGAGVWRAGDPAPNREAVIRPSEFLRVDHAAAMSGREGMRRAALAQFFADLRRRAEEEEKSGRGVSQSPVDDAECDRLVRELHGYLSSLGRDAERDLTERSRADSETTRRLVLNAVRGWGAYVSVEGHWLKYVATLRPGLQEALFAEAENAAADLEFRPAVEARPGSGSGAGARADGRVALEAKRVALGLGCGLGAFALSSAIVTAPVVVESIVNLAALGLGVVVGYSIGRGVFPARPTTDGSEKSPGAGARSGRILGWDEFQGRMTSWFSAAIRARQTTSLQECCRLAARFGIQEQIS